MADNKTAVDNEGCRFCGGAHFGLQCCPMVKSIDYYEDGTIKRVEYHDWYTNGPLPMRLYWGPVDLRKRVPREGS